MPERRGRVVLGFDFGLKRIGVASGDTISATAAPRAIVPVGALGADWAAIERLLAQFQPDLLVVGSPRHADGSPSALGAAADRFAAELGRRAGRAVERADEFASSIEATAALREARARAACAAAACNMPTSTAPLPLSSWSAGWRPSRRRRRGQRLCGHPSASGTGNDPEK